MDVGLDAFEHIVLGDRDNLYGEVRDSQFLLVAGVDDDFLWGGVSLIECSMWIVSEKFDFFALQSISVSKC